MELSLIVAAAAQPRDNGTWDMQGIGIGAIEVTESGRVQTEIAVLVLVRLDASDAGWHELRVHGRDADGQRIGPGFRQKFRAATASHAIIPVTLVVDAAPGVFEVRAELDDQSVRSWPISIFPRPSTP